MKTKSDYKINAIKNDAVDVESIKDLVKDYKYGQYTILDNKFEIEYNPLTHMYFFKNLYNHEALSLKGTCTELNITANAEIESKHPKYNLTRVQVTEPKFFHDDEDKHWALLVSEKKLLNTTKPADKKGIEKIVMQDPTLVDPSLKIVERLSETQYKILKAYVSGVGVAFYDSDTLKDGQAIPIWYSEKAGCMVYLNADTRFKSGLGIVIKREDSAKQYNFDINSELVKTIPDDDLRRMVETIQNKEIKITKDQYIQAHPIIIR